MPSTSNAMIRAVLFDLSGTVHIGNKVIPDALEACQKLMENNIAVKFLTNSTKSSRQELVEQLQSMGFDVDKNDSLVTNTQAARHTIAQHNLRPYCLVQDNLFEDLGLDASSTTSIEVFEETNYNSVLVGLAPEAFCYARLNQAFRVIMKEKERRKVSQSSHAPPFIVALHRGKYLRDVDGSLSLGPGGFVACLQEAAGISDADIAVMGKPSKEFFKSAIPKDIRPEETAMVGDDVRQDVIGAIEAGLGMGILVQTGKYQAGDEITEINGVWPHATVESIVQAADFIIENNNKLK